MLRVLYVWDNYVKLEVVKTRFTALWKRQSEDRDHGGAAMKHIMAFREIRNMYAFQYFQISTEVSRASTFLFLLTSSYLIPVQSTSCHVVTI